MLRNSWNRYTKKSKSRGDGGKQEEFSRSTRATRNFIKMKKCTLSFNNLIILFKMIIISGSKMIFRTSKASGPFSPHRMQCVQGFDRFWYFHFFIFWSPTYIETSIFDSFLAFRMKKNGVSSLFEVKVRCISQKFSIFSS